MNLLDLIQQSPASTDNYTIQQIVAVCGDGILRDGSGSSDQLRGFLKTQPIEKLANYANFCLEKVSGRAVFSDSGFVLQDVVNEIGRRLGYQVENGRYHGAVNHNGFDGLWFDGSKYLVIEVKTTDAYRINLDTVRGYADKLRNRPVPIEDTSLLIVVGRQDTGDLEAQVRGSRHAWSTRLISIDALLKLMFINEDLDDKALAAKARKILLPFEYTRVDNIVDLVFEAQQDSDQKAQSIDELVQQDGESAKFDFTPVEEIGEKRQQIVTAFFKLHGVAGIRKSKTNYSDASNIVGMTSTISKRYRREYQPYWYALHPQWLQFMKSVKRGYFVLGCMDRNEAFALPLALIEKYLPDLNVTEKAERHYWHISLTTLDGGRLALNLPRIETKVDLAPYAFSLTA